MKFICDKCSAKYSISDEKVRKKVLKIRCKKCSHVIIVRDPHSRAQRAGEQAGAARPAPASAAQPIAQPQPSSPYQAQPSPYSGHSVVHSQGQQGGLKLDLSEPQQQEERTVIARISTDWIRQVREEKHEEPIWFMAISGQPTGPVVKSEVLRNIQQGKVQADTLVWCGGWPEWTAASKVGELQEAFQAQARVTPPPIGAPIAAQGLKETPREPIHTPTPSQAFGEPSSSFTAQTQASTPSVEQLQAAQPSPVDSSHTLPSAQGASPLSLLQQPATSETIADPPRQEPIVPKPNGGAMSPSFGATLTPSQPVLAEPQSPLARGPLAPSQTEMPSVLPPSQTAPAPHQQDVAHEAQAVPAVEFIESSAEADFFAQQSSEFMAAAAQSEQDLVELALPPIPIDEPEEEFDIDDADIIEIRETLKPKWSARLAVAAGLGVIATLLTLPLLLNNRDSNATSKQIIPAPRISQENQLKPTARLSKKDEEARRRLLEQNGGGGVNPAAVRKTKPSKRKVRRRRVRRRYRPTRVIGLRKGKKKKTKLGSIDDRINKLFMKRFGGGKKKSGEPDVSGNIDRKLAKRLYKELNSQNSRVQYCYNLHLKRGNYLDGVLKLTLGVTPRGKVRSIKVSPRRFKGKRFTNCLVRTIRYQWRFTPFSGSETVYLEAKYSLKASY